MRKLIFTAIAAICAMGASAQGIQFFEGTIAEAFAKARQENKMIFVDCYTTWCGPCKVIAANVFPAKHAGDYFNPRFVCLKIDCEKGEGIAFAKEHEVRGYPTFMLFDAEGNKFYQQPGAPTELYAFVSHIKSVLMTDAEKEAIRKAWESDRNFATGLAILELENSTDAALVEEVVALASGDEKYDATLLSRYLYTLMFNRELSGNSPVFREYLRNFDRVRKVLGRNEANKMLENIYMLFFMRCIDAETSDIAIMERMCAEMDEMLPPDSYILHNGRFKTMLFKSDINGLMDVCNGMHFHGRQSDGSQILDLEKELPGLVENATPEKRDRLKQYFELYSKYYVNYAKSYQELADKFAKALEEM